MAKKSFRDFDGPSDEEDNGCFSFSKSSSKKRATPSDIDRLRRPASVVGRDVESQSPVDQCEINQTPPGTMKMGLLNVHSMNKRKPRISELITQNKLDAFLTTETWLKHHKADSVLSEASPEGFRFHYQVRKDGRRGGGVAIQFSEELQGEQIHFDSLNIKTDPNPLSLKELQRKTTKCLNSPDDDEKIKKTTSEFVVTELQHDDWKQPVAIVNVYRPPPRFEKKKRFRKFLDEFQSLLNEVKKKYSSIIVTGDFNIHVNKESRKKTKAFNRVLQANDLTQHVNEPTRGRNTLDLVMTRNVEVSNVTVQKDTDSDHSTVYFNAKPKDTEENKNEEQKGFRKTEE